MKHYSFPSIEQYRNVIRNVKSRAQYTGKDENGDAIYNGALPVPVLKYFGTVKLHGTNSGIVFDGTNLYAQSRSNVITTENDNAGFATYVEQNKQGFIDLTKKVGIATEENPVRIFGEWAGKAIQKGVAIANLSPKTFFVFAVRYNDQWLPNQQLKDIYDQRINTLNILHFPTWELEIDFSRPELAQEKLIEITTEVERECPVGKAFGLIGIGEGCVWRTLDENYLGSEYWFKVKGSAHSVSRVKVLASVDTEHIGSIREFVDNTVTENRLLQGVDKLREQGLPITERSTGEFLRWMYNDIVKEESDTMIANGIDPKEIGKYISEKARLWYFQRLNDDVFRG